MKKTRKIASLLFSRKIFAPLEAKMMKNDKKKDKKMKKMKKKNEKKWKKTRGKLQFFIFLENCNFPRVFFFMFFSFFFYHFFIIFHHFSSIPPLEAKMIKK